MIENLNFPAVGLERMKIIDAVSHGETVWENLSYEEKIIFVKGMHIGYVQGVRDQARQTINAFTQNIVGLDP